MKELALEHPEESLSERALSDMAKRKSILWISPIRPGPALHGNMAYQTGIMDLLIRNGCVIDYVYFGGWDIPSANLLPFRKVWKVLDENRVDQLEPNRLDDWFTDRLSRTVSRIGRERSYDMVIVDYVWMSRALVFDCFADCKKIIIGHDIFTDRDKVFTRLGMKPRWFHTIREEEARGLRRADLVVAITEADRKFYNEIAPETESVTWFDFDILALPRFTAKRHVTLGYMASDNHINVYAIRKFLSVLNDELGGYTDLEMNVAGNICKHFGSYKNIWIKKFGWVKDQREFFNKCDIVVMPMPESTGLKIKSLDALAYGKPFFSTKDVGSGLGSDSPYHNYSDIDAMARDIAALDKGGSLWKAGRAALNDTRRLSRALYVDMQRGKEKLLQAAIGSSGRKKPYASVSVIISVYNGEKTIARCLDSILQDPLEEKEIIVVDDASTDGTLLKLEKYRDRIIIIQNAVNIGQGPGRNRGLEIASGEYVYFVDADDEIDNKAIYKLYTKAIADNLDVCLIDIPQYKLRPLSLLPTFPAWGGIVRGSIIAAHELRQPDLRSGQDGVFSNMALSCSQKIAICENVSYKYYPSQTGTFLRYISDPSLLPMLVEKQLAILHRWYRETGASADRLLFFIHDETYVLRFKRTLNLLENAHSRKLYYMIKHGLLSLAEKCSKRPEKFMEPAFIDIANLSFEEWVNKWDVLN